MMNERYKDAHQPLLSGWVSNSKRIRRPNKYKFREIAKVKQANYSGVAEMVPFVYHCDSKRTSLNVSAPMKYYATPHRFLRHLPTLPFIYMAVFPLIFMDLWIEIYHRVCFPFYRIAYVKRREYIKTDRHKLKYLNVMQKINCFYCGYANGLVRYWVKIFAETEAYWCGIQHQKSENFKEPEHHVGFIPFGDEKAYRETYANNKTNKF